MKHQYSGEIKDCPFCGHSPHRNNLIDSLHPTGVRWLKSPVLDIKMFGDDYGYTHSHPNTGLHVDDQEITERGQYWVFTCLETEGGCDAQVFGDSVDEVMNKWNRRVQKKLDSTAL